jgi:ABC-2 type transport system permease protein
MTDLTRDQANHVPWASALRRHVRLWRACLSLAIVREAQFRAHFLTTVVIGIASILLGTVPVLILFNFTGDVQGWTQADVIVVLGVQQALWGLIGMIISHNMWAMMESVRNGELDQMLIRPVNAQFHAATRWIRPDQVFNILTGLAVVTIGLANGRGSPGPAQWVQCVIIFLCGFVLVACLMMAVSYCAFWTQSMDPAAMMVQDILQAGRYPVWFFPTAMRLMLTFIVPIAFATTFPSEALTHGISWWLVLGSVVFAALAVGALRALWNVAIRQYASASS